MNVDISKLSPELQQAVVDELSSTKQLPKTLVGQMGEAFREIMKEHVTFASVTERMREANPSLTEADLRTAQRQYDALLRLFNSLAPMRSYVPDAWHDRIVEFVKPKHLRNKKVPPKQLEFSLF